MDHKIKTLTSQNDQRKQELNHLNIEIDKLQIENENLKKEIKGLSTQTSQHTSYIPESNYKKIVLYGLAEYYREPENLLFNRLEDLFRDIAQVDLSGYIEDAYRMGRNTSSNRPLVIELISKRMVKYLLKNSQCFQGTGLFIAEFLDNTARKERAQLREELFAARKKGLHAIIRNKQLYIEGKLTHLNNVNNNTNKDPHTNSRELSTTMPTNITNPPCNEITSDEQEINTFRKERPTI
ncbi:unnamed protein product [Arctia plantaginis]|uniref:Uncharacterized protein n=1 Tax=Arctia plantaginis TaxID=874455 RepID=A0A8S1A8D9_ARCPL|nr:unnamed protein product [Arctia plantaginis]